MPDGAKLSSSLARLLDVKDEAHYGVIVVAPREGSGHREVDHLARGAGRRRSRTVTRTRIRCP